MSRRIAMQKQSSSVHEGFTKITLPTIRRGISAGPAAAFIAVADRVTSPVLDSGCGPGETALYFAARGHQVTGIDFVEEAIRQAKPRPPNAAYLESSLVKDAMALINWDERFASVIDSGLFHIYSGADRRNYVKGLAHVVRPGGRLFLYCFSNKEQAPGGGVSRQELYDAFADGWEVESVRSVRGEINPVYAAEFPDEFPKGGPKMQFAIIRRKE